MLNCMHMRIRLQPFRILERASRELRITEIRCAHLEFRKRRELPSSETEMDKIDSYLSAESDFLMRIYEFYS